MAAHSLFIKLKAQLAVLVTPMLDDGENTIPLTRIRKEYRAASTNTAAAQHHFIHLAQAELDMNVEESSGGRWSRP
jgi:hypothetical protein